MTNDSMRMLRGHFRHIQNISSCFSWLPRNRIIEINIRACRPSLPLALGWQTTAHLCPRPAPLLPFTYPVPARGTFQSTIVVDGNIRLLSFICQSSGSSFCPLAVILHISSVWELGELYAWSDRIWDPRNMKYTEMALFDDVRCVKWNLMIW